MYKLVDGNILSTSLQRAAVFGLSTGQGTCSLSTAVTEGPTGRFDKA